MLLATHTQPGRDCYPRVTKGGHHTSVAYSQQMRAKKSAFTQGAQSSHACQGPARRAGSACVPGWTLVLMARNTPSSLLSPRHAGNARNLARPPPTASQKDTRQGTPASAPLRSLGHRPSPQHTRTIEHMRPHRTTSAATANAPRAWRVITIVDHTDGEHECAIVEAFQSYELALHSFRNHHTAKDTTELRDPSGRCILDTRFQLPSNLEAFDDGLLEAPSGRYLYAYANAKDRDDCNGRFVPITASEVPR